MFTTPTTSIHKADDTPNTRILKYELSSEAELVYMSTGKRAVMKKWSYFPAATTLSSFFATDPCMHTVKQSKDNKEICHHFSLFLYYHYYRYRTYSGQLVIEFGRLMASSALSMDAVRNHYSDFLEMNHLQTALPRVRKKMDGFKAFKEILPSISFFSFPLLVSFQSERVGLVL